LSRKIPSAAVSRELAALLRLWTNKLKNGYNPYNEIKKKEILLSYNYLVKTVCDVCEQSVEVLRKKSKATYMSKITIFKQWIAEKNLDNVLVNEFSVDHAESFLTYLLTVRNLSATSRNASENSPIPVHIVPV
jgi:hypothetical protein